MLTKTTALFSTGLEEHTIEKFKTAEEVWFHKSKHHYSAGQILCSSFRWRWGAEVMGGSLSVCVQPFFYLSHIKRLCFFCNNYNLHFFQTPQHTSVILSQSWLTHLWRSTAGSSPYLPSCLLKDTTNESNAKRKIRTLNFARVSAICLTNNWMRSPSKLSLWAKEWRIASNTSRIFFREHKSSPSPSIRNWGDRKLCKAVQGPAGQTER